MHAKLGLGVYLGLFLGALKGTREKLSKLERAFKRDAERPILHKCYVLELFYANLDSWKELG